MKINIILSILFISFLFYGSVEYSHGIVGLTKLNGEGCVCHNTNPDTSVNVWIEGPDSVEINQTVTYRLYLTGGPEAAGGFNAASRTGILMPGDLSSKKIDLELTHTDPKVFAGDTVYWDFNYTAPGAVQWDTLYSVAQSVNNDGIPNNQDKWNFGPNFPVKVVPFVPVELISFTASAGENSVALSWSTASETNNSGFNIERKRNDKQEWQSISFVKGNNTTVIQSDYSFIDNAPLLGTSYYRLKQIDYNGQYSYSDVIEINFAAALQTFELSQNYPNPFNPATKIKYTVTGNESGYAVSLKVYDITGKLTAVLVDEKQSPGIYETEFNASSLSSGIYIYTLQGGNFSESRKMILMK